MNIRRGITTVASTVAAVLLAGTTMATGAHAGTYDNNNGTVWRNGQAQPMYSWVGGPGSCPSGYFCFYAHTQYDYHEWAFRESCNSYALSQWNGRGSWVNNSRNSVWFYGQNGNIVGRAAPGTSSADMDFNPVWRIDQC
ncbi:peptidase inhibitor family I36 protein [Kitasatospora sp. NPDC004240]